MTPADAQRISRVLTHDDHGAFKEIVVEHQSAVRRFLRNLTGGNAAHADDLAQETFLRAYEQLSRFRGESSLSTWLLGIAHNQYRNARRRDRTETLGKEALPAPDPCEPGQQLSDLKADLAAALEKLAVDERSALFLHYQQGLSHQEIADISRSPLGTVKTNIARGREKLSQLLSAWNQST